MSSGGVLYKLTFNPVWLYVLCIMYFVGHVLRELLVAKSKGKKNYDYVDFLE